jgi:HK97 gp10 family phage protein
MKIDITIKGLDEIKKQIQYLEKHAPDELKVATTQSAIYVERQAKHLCPVRTGRLRASITHEILSEGKKHMSKVGTDVHYAPHVEFGTVKASAQPYLVPALLESIATIKQFFVDAIQRVKEQSK